MPIRHYVSQCSGSMCLNVGEMRSAATGANSRAASQHYRDQCNRFSHQEKLILHHFLRRRLELHSQAEAAGSNLTQSPFLSELELLLAIHPVAAVTVGLVL